MSAIWIDERPKRDPERLRRAHIRARQARIERDYDVTYRQHKRVVRRPKSEPSLIDPLLVAGGVALVAMVLSLTAR